VIVSREKVESVPSRTGSAEGGLERIHWRVCWPDIVDSGVLFCMVGLIVAEQNEEEPYSYNDEVEWARFPSRSTSTKQSYLACPMENQQVKNSVVVR
jgi:hypothetical protein